MGFYPVCPATEEYVLGAPLFKKTTLTLENGKQLIINAPNNSESNKYVQELQWNNTTYTKNFINHFDVLNGAELNFNMSGTPNLQRGTAASSYPYSYSTSK
ncbi:MAG TPA: glycoside hydrolase domain-containing protein, partial [Flavobacterium sp.]